MKRFNTLAIIFMMCFTVGNAFGQDKVSSENYEVFGVDFSQIEKTEKSSTLYQNIQLKDTVKTQLVGEIREVCQSKGCWMKVNLSGDDEVFVKFKDYGFFVPLDAAGKKVVMNGKAFVEELSVNEQKHYAMDKGTSKEEIEKITSPKKTLRFEADGVLIKK
ncbi:DUF4920 domain-containing protein [uncultured Croceitalea sp.]|uniref:DUF4920 domain-containing protein n=1 Tax=uncultured Croceitalea sp. TaxID=1798908 RepID=UPI00374F6A46